MGDNLSNLAQSMAEFGAYCRSDVPVSSLQQSPQVVSSGSNSSATPKDHVIQGEMLVIDKTIPTYMYEMSPHIVIKREMIGLIVEELINTKHIEFTAEHQLSGDLKIRARIFVTPDNQVRLLREKGY